MKIGFNTAAESALGGSAEYLVELLARHVPQHEYVRDSKQIGTVDIYHSTNYTIPLSVWLRGIPRVVTVRNLNFMRYPQMFSFFDRLFRLRAYRHSCRTANCIITLNGKVKAEVEQFLHIESRKIQVVTPLSSVPATSSMSGEECERVRRKYALPDHYLLMVGTVEPRHHMKQVLDALADERHGELVICGRRTTYSDELLDYARKCSMAIHLNFIYELSPVDLPALFHLSQGFVQIPDPQLEASVVPIIEALRSGVPMVLSETALHRETADDAAVYVSQNSVPELVAALDRIIYDDEFRNGLIEKERQRAELFSEFAVAQRLIDIYTSL
ncbi:MAG: glycosyltransferase family 1 protein [Alistipes sp.]